MVIQSNMSSKSIIDVWEHTIDIFKKYEVPISNKALYSYVNDNLLESHLSELNEKVGSSTVTCIEGG